MKRLVLLFVLYPLFLFGQSRRKGVIDSIKTSTIGNLPNVFTILGNDPGTRMESTRVLDSGDYVTIVTRIYAPKIEYFTPLSILSIAPVAIADIVAARKDTMDVPLLPEIVPSLDPVAYLDIINVALATIPSRKKDTLSVPLLPEVFPSTEPILLLEVVVVGPKIIPIPKKDTVAIPPLPEVILDELPLTPVLLMPSAIARRRPDMLDVPDYEVKKMPVEEMHLSPEGYSLLEKMEGFSPSLYALKDGGYTIGFGFFMPYAEGAKWDKGVTLEEAEEMIKQKMPAYEHQVKRYINVPVTQNEFDALTMLAYNLGGFSRATSIVNDINTQADFDKLQSDWNRFVHSKAPNVTRGLMNRRKDEIRVRGEAYYQPERKIIVLKNK